jgi:hypothetical protein
MCVTQALDSLQVSEGTGCWRSCSGAGAACKVRQDLVSVHCTIAHVVLCSVHHLGLGVAVLVPTAALLQLQCACWLMLGASSRELPAGLERSPLF